MTLRKKKEYRATAIDLYHAAQIAHELENIHFFQRTMVPRDIEDNLEMDINTLYACCAGTTKHIGTSISDPSHVDRCIEFLHLLSGGDKNWGKRPFVSNSNCFVVPPMKFATESCITMEKCIWDAYSFTISRTSWGNFSSFYCTHNSASSSRMSCWSGLC